MFQEGQQIGNYTLITRLGRGGFGEVWLAEKRAKFVTTKVATNSLKENNPKIIEVSHRFHAGHLAFGIIKFQDVEGNLYQQDLRENENKIQRHSFPKLIDNKTKIMSYARSKFRHPALPKNDLDFMVNLSIQGNCFYV